jgi:hypothetical protein
MYRDRGGGGGSSRSEIVGGPLDRKRINDALDKHLEKSSPSTSRGGGINSKDKERLSVPSTSTGKSQPLDHRDSRSVPLSKNKCSDGQPFSLLLFFSFQFQFFFFLKKKKKFFGKVNFRLFFMGSW